MNKNPFINALAAVLYVALVVSFISSGPMFFPKEDGLIVPLAMLSLFVFSAAIMGFLFLYAPLLLLSEGKKKEATDFFLKTAFSFGAVSALLVIGWLSLMGFSA